DSVYTFDTTGNVPPNTSVTGNRIANEITNLISVSDVSSTPRLTSSRRNRLGRWLIVAASARMISPIAPSSSPSSRYGSRLRSASFPNSAPPSAIPSKNTDSIAATEYTVLPKIRISTRVQIISRISAVNPDSANATTIHCPDLDTTVATTG